jgi:hypothetical protein
MTCKFSQLYDYRFCKINDKTNTCLLVFNTKGTESNVDKNLTGSVAAQKLWTHELYIIYTNF